MHFQLLALALAPLALAAQSATQPAVTQTVTLVPSGYTPPTSTPTPTPTSTATPTSTPASSSTPLSSSASFVRVSSTPLVVKPTATGATGSAAPAATTMPASGANTLKVSGLAGIFAVAGLLIV